MTMMALRRRDHREAICENGPDAIADTQECLDYTVTTV